MIVFRTDPRTYSGMLRVGTGFAITEGLEDVQHRLGDIQVPLLAIHGTADQVTDPAGSRLLYDATSPHIDKELHIIEGGSHGLLGSIHSAVVMEALTNWLNRRSV
jgi:alpha-beta hydrolase superfamily lysophospholipase